MDYHEYVSGIAEARHAIRKAFRIVDEQAKKVGLDPLEHQTLLQVYGSAEEMLHVNSIATRLDIAPAFASRLVRQLETMGYVRRTPSLADRRVTEVHMTDKGREIIRSIDSDVRIHVDYFQRNLPWEAKTTALSIMAFYVGIDLTTEDIAKLALQPVE
jgi:DNA-binding MarR family transcriptional regulator